MCDENTYLVTKDDIAYGDGKRIKVKGKNIPVRIFEPKSVEIDAEKSHRLVASQSDSIALNGVRGLAS